MEVKLLYYTENPELSIVTAARICYSSKDAYSLYMTLDDNEINNILNTILDSGHLSVLEHVSYTFSIEEVSRSLTHQLVRHRLASYNQQSQRYVKFSEGFKTIKPDTIKQSSAEKVFDDTIATIENAYNELLESGVPAEDARYLLPNAAATNIVVTMNARELFHFFEMRCCNRAQWEIRELAYEMLKLVKNTAPHLFKNVGAPCVKGHCPEGKMSCGNPYTSRD